MEIYVIRHTATATPQGLCYGQTDVSLAENYPQDFEKIQCKIPRYDEKTVFFSSPLLRCRQLADFLSPHVQYDSRLLEMNFGLWENQLFEALNPIALRAWTENFVEISAPQGENFQAVYQRVGEFWEDLLRMSASQVFIITHAGVIRALLAHILQLPLQKAFQFRVDYGSVHKFQRKTDFTYIDFLNA
jgi:alpha-ribazole phosphatase